MVSRIFLRRIYVSTCQRSTLSEELARERESLVQVRFPVAGPSTLQITSRLRYRWHLRRQRNCALEAVYPRAQDTQEA